MVAHAFIKACELNNKRRRLPACAVLAFAVVLTIGLSTPMFAQQPEHAPPTTEAPGVAAEQGEHAAEEEHHSVWAGLLWPTVNFAILFGGLWYFLKEPFTTYLRDRHAAIRKDLVEAFIASQGQKA